MKIAVVTPWFGKDLTGGAERLAWEIAFGMRDRVESVTVFSTCARSFSDPWNKNFHPPGETNIDGVRLMRFTVDPANPQRFHEINRKLLAFPRDRLKPGVELLDEIELRDFVGNNINSTPLLTHLARRGDEYDAIFFLPYLYGLTLRGWRVVRERAIITPCLHDEAYAYLPPVAEMMRGSARLVFNSRGSFELARRLYGPGIEPRSAVVGAGITWPDPSAGDDSSPIAGFSPEGRRYVLYVGRRSPEKNVGLLTQAFNRYLEIEPESDLSLVFAGTGSAVRGARTVVLGNVDERQKYRLLRNALALAQPSENESFSRVIMEAWAVGSPVVVSGNCPSTTIPVSETGAGWAPLDLIDWTRVLSEIDSLSRDDLRAIGARASTYVAREASWANVLERYATVLDAMDEARRRPSNGRTVTHVLERAGYADSATLLALQYSGMLEKAGFESRVVARHVDPRLGTQVRLFEADADIKGATLKYGAGGVLGPIAVPPWLDLNLWNVEPNGDVMASLVDGQTNIVAVGAIAPENHTLDIVEAFAFYFTLDFGARLLLVGAQPDEAYLVRVREAIERTGLDHRVQLCGEVSRPALSAMYRTAHLFVSLRDHYETGLALMEAMAHDIPVCALASPRACDILGESGVLIADASQSAKLAALWRILVKDDAVRSRVLRSQRARTLSSAGAVVDALERMLPAGLA